jgi:hypothetical protein
VRKHGADSGEISIDLARQQRRGSRRGTCVIDVFVVSRRRAVARWTALPTPTDAYVYVPGFSRTLARKSLSEFTPIFGPTTSTVGLFATMQMGANDLKASKWMRSA